jgi:peptidoglycan/LPS O-acetylase OafA/YrhL
MTRTSLAFALPPLAVRRYGCAGACAGPIAVVWITSLVSIVFGFLGGPTESPGPNWLVVGLGVLLWLVSGLWARLVLVSVEEDEKALPDSSRSRRVDPRLDESDPFNQLR